MVDRETRARGERLTRRLANPDLRCKNKCGFYGNTIYRGYCSKCFKEVQQLAEPSHEQPTELLDPGSGSLFNRFTIKKRVQQTAKGHGRIVKRGSTLRPSLPLKEGSRLQGFSKKRGSRVVEPFNEFLKNLRKPAAEDISSQLKLFKKHVLDSKVSTSTVEELGESVQEFYTGMGERLQTHPLFKNMNEEQQEDLIDCIEKHLMTGLYQYVFSAASSDDEVKDLLLVRRIRMLGWLLPQHLDITLNLHNPVVQTQISQGREELWAMDSKKAPQDKLHCISKCSTHLMSALKHSQEVPPSADEFLPALIFLLIHSIPQHLHSNINYISRFSNPMRVMSGEAGYYFTNLCAAMSFVETISAEVLNMKEVEFNSHMGYVAGRTDADLLIHEKDEEEAGKEKIHVLQSCCQCMKELSSHLQLLLVEARELEDKMEEFRVGITEQVSSIVASRPPSQPMQHVPDLIDLGDAAP